MPALYREESTLSHMTSQEVAAVAAEAALDKRARDVEAIDVSGMSDVTDCIVVATADNAPQMGAVVDEVHDKVYERCSEKPFSVEGKGADWVLLDYGHVVVHVMKPEAREYYRIERLWGDAPRLDVELA